LVAQAIAVEVGTTLAA